MQIDTEMAHGFSSCEETSCSCNEARRIPLTWRGAHEDLDMKAPVAGGVDPSPVARRRSVRQLHQCDGPRSGDQVERWRVGEVRPTGADVRL